MVCPGCGAENPPSSKFCGDCGVGLPDDSPGKEIPSSALSAPGIRVAAGEADTSAAADGERKTVTGLFAADIKDSMELMEDIDPEEARAIVRGRLPGMAGRYARETAAPACALG